MTGLGSIDPFILLIVTTVLVLAIFILSLVQVIRRRPTIGPITVILLILGLIFVVYLVLYGREIKPADWPQILLMIGLVTITAVYAWSTQKMAEEMRQQRLGEARPYLLLRLKLKKDELLQWDDYKSSKHPTEFPVKIRNVGKGPAINLWVALWHPTKIYFGDSKGYLAPNEEWETTISRISVTLNKRGWLPQLKKSIKREYPGVATVKYNDIHQRTWVSYLCLERHVDLEYFVIEGEQNIVELRRSNASS